MTTHACRTPSRLSLAALLALTAATVSPLVAPASAQSVQAVQIASGFTRPDFLTHAPGNPGVLYVVQTAGQIRMISHDGDDLGTFADISSLVSGGTSSETGLLGLAFSPDYETSGRFFLYYTAQVDNQLTSVLEEFQRGENGLADNTPVQRLLAIPQQFTNHNGGWLAFGLDGYLYLAVGDGGSSNDPSNNASNLNSIKGKILRLDVSDPDVPYTVPESNPFANTPGALGEIWAYGLRNPWRNSFDRETGDLWIADVGQNRTEEINFQPASSTGGEHYGWRCREGNTATPGVSGCPDSDPLWVDPVRVYVHAQTGRCSITGGYVYRGCALADEVYGQYFYGDYCTGEIWTHDPATNQRTFHATVGALASFGEDENGELYAVSLNGGIYRLLPTDPGSDANGDLIPDPCDCPAEFNGDGIRDNGDVRAFVDAFTEQRPEADLNGDGIVDNNDVGVFIQAFLETCR